MRIAHVGPQRLHCPRLQGARPELTEDQRAEIKEAFDLFDTEKTGKLDYHELKVGSREGGEVVVIIAIPAPPPGCGRSPCARWVSR